MSLNGSDGSFSINDLQFLTPEYNIGSPRIQQSGNVPYNGHVIEEPETTARSKRK